MTTAVCDQSPQQLRAELLTRVDAARHGHDNDGNVRWLVCVIAIHGWPVRRLVGRDGATAALLLADFAPLPYRASWASKITNALDARTVPARAAREFLERLATERQTTS